MHKSRSDVKVKKTLIRNCEKQVKPTNKQVIRDVGSTRANPAKSSGSTVTENELYQPSLCSSQALAHYISDAKISVPPASDANLDIDRAQISAKVTKKLNFHFNESIYRNLIELNTNVEDLKKKKDKRPSSSASAKKELEPNIEDFYEDVKDLNFPPNIPIIRPKFKPVKNVENGQLHKLVSVFEYL